MIKYTRKEEDSFPLMSNSPERFSRSSLENFVANVTVNVLLAPIALLVLVALLGGLVVAAFGKNSDWGLIPKILVGIGIPTLVIAAVSNVRVGNTIFIIWYCLFWGAAGIALFGSIFYFAFTDYLELF